MVDIDVEQLPDDTKKLKAMLVEQRRAYEELQEKFELLRRVHFGQSSEKLTPEDIRQMRLFNEAEELAHSNEEHSPTVTVGEHHRKKPGRRAISADIPREEVIHDLQPEQKRCPCCGKDRPLLDDEITEEVEIVPARAKVLRHIRKVYGPCGCSAFEASKDPPVVRAPMAARMIPGSIAAPGFLAYVLTAKFVDALPFYRQERIFSRLGVTISRSTLAAWAIAVAARCGPLIELMWKLIREGPFQQMDETTIQVLHERNRPVSAKSYVWVNLGFVYEEGKEEHEAEVKPIVLYHYHPSRSAKVITATLEGYKKGHLQTDGYEAYAAALAEKPGIVHVGCLAHLRRKFHDATKITKKPGSAEQALAFIAKLYRIEKECRERLSKGLISRAQFVEERSEKAMAILQRFKTWLEERSEQVPPTIKLGEAISYALAQWQRVIRYLEAWYLTPDTNAVERSIRPFVIGRSNWLFSDTPRGAHASTALYSLVETARANGLEPYHYLRYLFERLAGAGKDEGELRKLLPINLTPTDILTQ